MNLDEKIKRINILYEKYENNEEYTEEEIKELWKITKFLNDKYEEKLQDDYDFHVRFLDYWEEKDKSEENIESIYSNEDIRNRLNQTKIRSK